MTRLLSCCICLCAALLPATAQAQAVEVFHQVFDIKGTTRPDPQNDFTAQGYLLPETKTTVGGIDLNWCLHANSVPLGWGVEGTNTNLWVRNTCDGKRNISFHAALLDASNQLVGAVTCEEAIDARKSFNGFVDSHGCWLSPGSVARIAKVEVVAYVWQDGTPAGKFHEGSALLPAAIVNPSKGTSRNALGTWNTERFRAPQLPRKVAGLSTAKNVLRIDGSGIEAKLDFKSERKPGLGEEMTATVTARNNSGKDSTFQGLTAFRDAQGRLLACMRFGDNFNGEKAKSGAIIKCYLSGSRCTTHLLPPGTLERIACISTAIHRITPAEKPKRTGK